MKRICILCALCCLLSGCAVPTFETLGNVLHEEDGAQNALQISAALPADAVRYGNAYFCDGYYVELQTIRAADLNATVAALSGFQRDELTIMTGMTDDQPRYEWVWSAVSEEGEVVCRAMVIASGAYHYCMTAVAPAAMGGALAEEWNRLFSSFTVS